MAQDAPPKAVQAILEALLPGSRLLCQGLAQTSALKLLLSQIMAPTASVWWVCMFEGLLLTKLQSKASL